jgi:hypothetical protein
MQLNPRLRDEDPGYVSEAHGDQLISAIDINPAWSLLSDQSVMIRQPLRRPQKAEVTRPRRGARQSLHKSAPPRTTFSRAATVSCAVVRPATPGLSVDQQASRDPPNADNTPEPEPPDPHTNSGPLPRILTCAAMAGAVA